MTGDEFFIGFTIIICVIWIIGTIILFIEKIKKTKKEAKKNEFKS